MSNTRNLLLSIGLSAFAHAALIAAWPQETIPSRSTPGALSITIHRDTSAGQDFSTGDDSRAPPEQTRTPEPTFASKPAPRPVPDNGMTTSVGPIAASPAADHAGQASSETGIDQPDQPPPGGTRLNREQHIRAGIIKLVTARLDYPVIARRKGWQGTVTLKLVVQPDGLISETRLNKSSGYTILDRAAMETLRLASIPDAAFWLQGAKMEIVIPVEYRLIDT